VRSRHQGYELQAYKVWLVPWVAQDCELLFTSAHGLRGAMSSCQLLVFYICNSHSTTMVVEIIVSLGARTALF
jgi:hypothetical protein